MTTVQLITQTKEYSPHKLAANNKVPTGQGKLEKVREYDWQGKKVMENPSMYRKPGKMKIHSHLILNKYVFLVPGINTVGSVFYSC